MIVETLKSPIVLGLETMGLLVDSPKQKSDLKENRAFANENITTDDLIIK